MDRSIRDLEALVASQKEQLARYEKRLKDVVAAYKGLLKEKEALETSLAVTAATSSSNKSDSQKDTTSSSSSKNGDFESSSIDTKEIGDEQKDELQKQIMTLMNSLATLSAEKSRMEASFQADKKQLRLQLSEKDQSIAELQRQLKESTDNGKANVEEMKAKWIIERQEREKESNNQMIMIRELQKLYADERHLKESIEMQLNNFKTQFASNEAENSRVRELQAQLKEARTLLKQLEANRKEVNGAESVDGNENSAVLQQVRREMQQLKDQHAIAIKTEQRRVQLAEEESRKAVALHEDRVANLEARLAELSCTVGNYDRLRQQDQESIQNLKSKLYELERSAENTSATTTTAVPPPRKAAAFGQMHQDMSAIVDEIMRLKKLLINENVRSSNPIDVSKVFAVGADHSQCHNELKRVEKELNEAKMEIEQLKENVQVQKAHISTLQEKVKILNRNIDEQETELKQQSERQRQAVKEERSKWKQVVNELENDQRQRVNELEQQLQKQRQRSLQLLDEKEQEIKTLQTSFEVFHSATAAAVGGLPIPTSSGGNAGGSSGNENNAHSSDDGESVEGSNVNHNHHHKINELKPKKLSVGENCHMLHYANEIARKDIEIAGLRKTKYAAETALRRAIQDKVAAQEELNERIEVLEEQVDRLERCKTREGANLEYLKNVIISFIATKDSDGKRHMMNAISAVLQFTPTEIQTINAAFQKK